MSTTVEIRLPQFGMGMVDGTVTMWFKAEGDSVAVDEVVAEVETAKSTEELVAPATGVMGRILVPEGATVDVHTLLAVIVPVGVDASAVDLPLAVEPARTADPPSAPPDWGPMPVPATSSADASAGRQITPRARRLASDLGVALDAVVGTGPGGRVTEDDVQSAILTKET